MTATAHATERILVSEPDEFPPVWASAWGEDRLFGRYVELHLGKAVQRFRWILPGTFMMGSPATEKDRGDNEIQHWVTLTKGYWLADTAVTQALWVEVMGENPSRFTGDERLPVESVSWHDATAFIAKLNDRVPRLNAGLPSEAQWEYACRAGSTTPFAFGATITAEQVNYNGNYPYAGTKKGLYREKTVPVASLPANGWGLYEMHGNVWEWCSDWYDECPREAVLDPEGAGQGSGRVLRGGAWIRYAQFARSAQRYALDPGERGIIGSLGFRLAPGRPAGVPAERVPESERRESESRGTTASVGAEALNVLTFSSGAKQSVVLQLESRSQVAREVVAHAPVQALLSAFFSRLPPSLTNRADTSGFGALAKPFFPDSIRKVVTANAPWQLVFSDNLADWPWEAALPAVSGAAPVAVTVPIVRTFANLTPRNSSAPAPASGSGVLILADSGDGSDSNPNKASREADQLESLCREARSRSEVVQRGLHLERIDIGARAEAITPDLVGERGWKIVHIAGQGIFDAPTNRPALSGMLLPRGGVFGPIGPQGFARPPELLFVNATMGVWSSPERALNADPKTRLSGGDRAGALPRFATHFTRELLGSGVRCVVIAAVRIPGDRQRDSAVDDFAASFYAALFQGQTAAQAVLAARQAVHRADASGLGWIVYQCWGDGAWRP